MIRTRLQQTAFRLLYRWGRWAYDPLTVLLFGGEWHTWRQTILPHLRPGKILDIGCGTGTLLHDLSVEHRYVVGLDQETAMIQRAARHRLPRRIDLVQGDARLLPFADSTFDSCVATFPSAVILEPDTRSEIARVLVPGGTFAVVLGGHLTGSGPIRTPVRLALRLFYGSRSRELPPDTLLENRLLTGQWIRHETRHGYALVWIAQKNETPSSGASSESDQAES